MPGPARLSRLVGHLDPAAQQWQQWRHTRTEPATCTTGASALSPSSTARPAGSSAVKPTRDAAVALADFVRDGFCILEGVLSPEQVVLYRDHLLGVMGDNTCSPQNDLLPFCGRSLSTAIGTPTTGRGGCSRMTVSPTAQVTTVSSTRRPTVALR